MRISSVLSLLYFAACCVWASIILHYGLPQSHNIQGSNISYVPLTIGVLQLLAAVFSIFLSRRINPPPLKSLTPLRWVLLVVSVIVLFCGFAVFSVSLYSPYLFGSQHSVPKIGVISWLVITLIVAAILYVVSKMNSARRPNLFRYIALVVALIAASLTTVQALILIYAVPVEPPAAFPFLSGLMTIAFIPFALLLLGLSKNYVSIRKDNQEPEQD